MPVGGVLPNVNCMDGGESWHISGIGCGGADTLRLFKCRLGLDVGDFLMMPESGFRAPAVATFFRVPSSGNGPNVDAPSEPVELIPDIADSPERVRDRIRDSCICW